MSNSICRQTFYYFIRGYWLWENDIAAGHDLVSEIKAIPIMDNIK
jgi:hypothetical protein